MRLKILPRAEGRSVGVKILLTYKSIEFYASKFKKIFVFVNFFALRNKMFFT